MDDPGRALPAAHPRPAGVRACRACDLPKKPRPPSPAPAPGFGFRPARGIPATGQGVVCSPEPDSAPIALEPARASPHEPEPMIRNPSLAAAPIALLAVLGACVPRTEAPPPPPAPAPAPAPA